MGVCGHIGLAFDPADEALAIASVNGEGEDQDWLRYQTEFGLIREDYWELHLVLQTLVATNASLAPLATAIIGDRAVGEGPTYPMCLYPAAQVRLMADAFARVSGEMLEQAIIRARSDHAQDDHDFPLSLSEAFRKVGGELEKVAANGWSLIAFMF